MIVYKYTGNGVNLAKNPSKHGKQNLRKKRVNFEILPGLGGKTGNFFRVEKRDVTWQANCPMHYYLSCYVVIIRVIGKYFFNFLCLFCSFVLLH